MKKTILICENHKAYPTPLLSTMAFRHCELWCPFCGRKLGMFDGGTDTEWTQQLQDRHDKYKENYSEYLHACGLTYAVGTMWKGERVHPDDLPDEEKERLKNIRENGWKEKIKSADL